MNGVATGNRIVDNVNAIFGYSTNRPRSSLSLFGRVGVNVPRDSEQRNRANFGLGLGWNHSVTEHFQSRLDVGASRNFSIEKLSNLGFFAPNLTSYSANAGWGTQYQVSARTTISTSLGYRFREFQNSQAIPSSQIVLDEQPFGDDLSVPVDEDLEGFLPIPDAEDDVLAILATEGLPRLAP